MYIILISPMGIFDEKQTCKSTMGHVFGYNTLKVSDRTGRADKIVADSVHVLCDQLYSENLG